jgi:2-keto-myo-inositol isomerase
MKPTFDFYHFWAGLSKFEDIELIHTGEILHVHFQDVPDIPRELLDSTTREVPGEGISPLPRILRALAAKGYSGPLSVELFYPHYQNADPYEMAGRIREKVQEEARAWNQRVSRDGVKINWKFDRKAARRKFGYERNSFKRPET